ncbi:hypothetical protein FXN63_20215 [Pigmentiphaga aceris]|uniref:protein acetyllysine N-acetyltransferase n=1 Tax=Pigmentiphaga aceris TaxID=1940612 RepID=A0A5C0B1Y5_9BURK|nr:Sir2 family NAD-dependent protein deacetylase [Pigmentiphaga aceris]QEI07904.1 hypothetical protein FXN63_20215 [Pigmentiphaga aceris]
MSTPIGQELAQAVAWLEDADGLLIVAGSGMAAGLSETRDSKSLARALSVIGRVRPGEDDIGSPDVFRDSPRAAWGTYGKRLKQYRDTDPHPGYAILRRWTNAAPQGSFVYTSNVDGHFQKAGFAVDRIVEAAGSIHWLQCVKACTPQLWSADELTPSINPANGWLAGVVPTCPQCGSVARPNVSLAKDWDWVPNRTMRQHALLSSWLFPMKRLVVVEVGAGTLAIRRFSEQHGPRVIRIHPTDFDISPDVGLGFATTALDGLRQLDECRAPALKVAT